LAKHAAVDWYFHLHTELRLQVFLSEPNDWQSLCDLPSLPVHDLESALTRFHRQRASLAHRFWSAMASHAAGGLVGGLVTVVGGRGSGPPICGSSWHAAQHRPSATYACCPSSHWSVLAAAHRTKLQSFGFGGGAHSLVSQPVFSSLIRPCSQNCSVTGGHGGGGAHSRSATHLAPFSSDSSRKPSRQKHPSTHCLVHIRTSSEPQKAGHAVPQVLHSALRSRQSWMTTGGGGGELVGLQTSGPQSVSVAVGYEQPTVAAHSMLPPGLTGAALAVATPRAMAASVVVAMVGMMQWLIHVCWLGEEERV